ncbi:MAG: hypothetical protein UV70_C0019G0007 [Parcubacteria group bacterium GW2011_GWA2_43_13]|nr:MAG: hypothetical protein UV70_C0019G0007 [Parcubacteria group bacterium GW2011_GWA2_43_13]
MWTLPAVNAVTTFHSCHSSRLVIVRSIAVIAIGLSAKLGLVWVVVPVLLVRLVKCSM